ncbi:hypothetical protein F220043C3_21820 [Enterocloster asparagiformis]
MPNTGKRNKIIIANVRTIPIWRVPPEQNHKEENGNGNQESGDGRNLGIQRCTGYSGAWRTGD